MDNKEQIPSPLSPEEFKKLGYQLIDDISGFLQEIRDLPVSPGHKPQEVRDALGQGTLPAKGTDPASLLKQTAALMKEYSVFNGHPRFMAYITSSALPIGALGDLLASAYNPNVGGWQLSPMATEIEVQTVKWIAEFIGYPVDCGGILVSGGNMANMLAFLVARKNLGKDMDPTLLTAYVSKETHTWIHKSADLFGIGRDNVRWIEVDAGRKMDLDELEKTVLKDIADGFKPFMAVGTAGSVSLGVIDPLKGISEICEKYDMWFHIDGAYGAPAAATSLRPLEFDNLKLADSVAVDPHKWLYSPLEAGCTLVKDPNSLKNTFSHRPDYYEFDEDPEDLPVNYFEHGLQNSRGFRALKIWLSFRYLGRDGLVKLIEKDIDLSRQLYTLTGNYPEIMPFMNALSITTFAYVPMEMQQNRTENREYLNEINKEILFALQYSGTAYISNALIDGDYLLRACLVNFRTKEEDLVILLDKVVELGNKIHLTQK